MASAEPPPPGLAAHLYEEQDWAACRVEALRELHQTPNDHPLLLIRSLSELHLGGDPSASLLKLIPASGPPDDVALQAHAALAGIFMKNAQWSDAFRHSLIVFQSATNVALCRTAAGQLDDLLRRDPDFNAQAPGLSAQLATARPLWQDAGATNRTALSGRPAEWIVQFYRSEIGPAVGQRCPLVPSCSIYALQALQKHGALGIALTADRLVREPAVVAGEPAIASPGRRYLVHPDPLEKHDGWMHDNAP